MGKRRRKKGMLEDRKMMIPPCFDVTQVVSQ
jgi:hypothetical protein